MREAVYLLNRKAVNVRNKEELLTGSASAILAEYDEREKSYLIGKSRRQKAKHRQETPSGRSEPLEPEAERQVAWSKISGHKAREAQAGPYGPLFGKRKEELDKAVVDNRRVARGIQRKEPS